MQNDSQASFWPTTLQPFGLGHKPKVKVATIIIVAVKKVTLAAIIAFIFVFEKKKMTPILSSGVIGRRQRQLVVIAFFFLFDKKTMAMCHCLLLW